MVDTQYGFDGFSVGSIRVTWTRVIGAGAAVGAFAGLYALLVTPSSAGPCALSRRTARRR